MKEMNSINLEIQKHINQEKLMKFKSLYVKLFKILFVNTKNLSITFKYWTKNSQKEYIKKIIIKKEILIKENSIKNLKIMKTIFKNKLIFFFFQLKINSIKKSSSKFLIQLANNFHKKCSFLSKLVYIHDKNLMIKEKYSFNNSDNKSYFFNKWEMRVKNIKYYMKLNPNNKILIMKLVHIYE